MRIPNHALSANALSRHHEEMNTACEKREKAVLQSSILSQVLIILTIIIYMLTAQCTSAIRVQVSCCLNYSNKYVIKLVSCDLSCADHSINKMNYCAWVIGYNLFIISFPKYDMAQGARPCSLSISRNIGMAVGSWVPLYFFNGYLLDKDCFFFFE